MTAPVRYLSVCSGIDVASLAWMPLGWQPVLVSEIEAFPREVLRIRHNASHRADSDTYVPVLATTLRARDGAKGVDSDATDTLIPVAFGGNRQSGPVEVATALNAHGGPHGRLDFETETFVVTPFDTTQLTNRHNRSNPRPGGPCHPLSAQAHPPAISFNARQDPDVAGEISGPLDTDGGTQAILTSGVRRLMPVECERLQGVPDNFTRIPWRGQPEELCPDGPRYRVLGNAYPKPVLDWLGRRINRAFITSALEAAE